jgi:hypothetical protein
MKVLAEILKKDGPRMGDPFNMSSRRNAQID